MLLQLNCLHSPSNTFTIISSLVDCVKSVSLQQSHSRVDIGCLTQGRSNAYQYLCTLHHPCNCVTFTESWCIQTAIDVNWQIIDGSCTCVAGQSAITLLLDDINSACEHGNGGGPSSTSLPRKWGVPTKSKKEPTRVKKLEMTTPKYGKVLHFIEIQPLILNLAQSI